MILTDAKGKPIEKPKREDFKDSGDFLRAMNAYNDRVRSNAGDLAAKGIGKRKKGEEAPQREPDDDATRKAKVAEMMKKWAVKGR